VTRLARAVVATTRDGDPDDTLVRALEAEGAQVLIWPTLRFEASGDLSSLEDAGARCDEYDWTLFTSVRSVRALVELEPPPPQTARVAAVGPATARALHDARWRVDVVGDGGAAALIRRMAERFQLAGSRMLFPAGSMAEDTLETELRSRGASVERVEAYRMFPRVPDVVRVRSDLREGVDVVTFASPSAVRAFAEVLGPDWPRALSGACVVAMGTSTSAELARTGVEEVVVAPEATMAGIVEACVLLLDRD
jgi:uroporphyrinogen-III synthase